MRAKPPVPGSAHSALVFGPPDPSRRPVRFPAGRDRLIQGECLAFFDSLPAGCVQFLYADPPFGTGRDQPYRFGLGRTEAPLRDAMNPDRWLAYWEPRLAAMVRSLAPAGILVLHLDPRLAPAARRSLDLSLDSDAFLNEIIWHYRSGGIARDRLARKHDTLLVYRNGAGHTFHPMKVKRYLAHRAMRPNVEEHRDEGGWYRFAALDDVWEIPILAAEARERVGYPTQKPEALIDRLLALFTNPGDLVVDPVCGSGTLAVCARRAGRHWIAADHDSRAIACAAGRIARHVSPLLKNQWDEAGVAGRRDDLGVRLGRLRARPDEWGLSEEERDAAKRSDASAPGFTVESVGAKTT